MINRKIVGVGMVLIFAVACVSGAADVAQTEKEVWETVEARINAWSDNDYEAYLDLHHDGWHRYSMVTSDLMSKEDVPGFWQAMKSSEKVLSIDVEPIAIDVFGDQSVAIAHYVAQEVFEWTAETRERENGRLMEQGTVYHVPARFSDVYVKEGGRWLYVGGYRDLTCDIFSKSKNPCRD